MHYYQFNIADYRKDTMHLSRLEHGIYRDLIDWYYLDEQPIPLETQSVSRRLRLVSEEEAKALKNVLSDFFTLSDDGYRHSRIDVEIANYYATCEKNKENGKKGGRPKVIKPLSGKEDNPMGYESVATGNPNETQINPNQEPITNNQEPVKNNADKPHRFDFFKSLLSEGVSEQTAKDYIAARKAKRCVQTETAFNIFMAEVSKSGLTVPDAVAICCKKSWGGFEADWLLRDRANARGSPVASIEARNKANTAGWVPPEMRQIA